MCFRLRLEETAKRAKDGGFDYFGTTLTVSPHKNADLINRLGIEIGEKYKIAPKRLASLVDIFACAFISLMPHDGGMLMITALADVSPLNVLKYSFYMFGLIIATCVTIQFGLMDEKN